ncbi:CLUMA_CG013307, isoform A [Clunio marinus]|uniref:CLUMA_CG013307, isoform A n=1 Tax=Clunio marinus TaxID=568069 RepID=A0A1J1IJT2_9DIPT|nr:CLUMA_CG013307, isoform A [Clunio marinus]
MNTILASSLPTKKFIDPDSCSVPFHDIAQQNINSLLKNESTWILKQSVGQIGWRTKKHYFKVNQKVQSGQKQIAQAKLESQPSTSSYKENSEQEFLISWTEFGPDKQLSDKEINTILKSLSKIKHPFIFPIEYINSNENGCLTIRKFHKEGSLKDMLCGSQPLNAFSMKYGNTKGRIALPLEDLSLYSRQILEALKFLHSKGLPYGHLTTANIFIENGAAKLSAIENFILGVSSFYRPFFVQHSRVNSMEMIDVFTFGHVLFEMQSTYSLQEPCIREVSDCPTNLKALLELIIAKDSLKSTSPSLDHVLSHKFFKEFEPKFEQLYSGSLKSSKVDFDLPAKESILKASQKTEQRLKDEQKLVKSQKRVTQSQKMMITEEEKRKQSKQKLKTQNSLQNGPINFRINLSETSRSESKSEDSQHTGSEIV